MWDLHPSAVQGSHLPRCSALISAHAAALQPHGSAALEQLWKMEGVEMMYLEKDRLI